MLTGPSYPPALVVGPRRLDFAAATVVMGVLNVTPDSFSDGGQFADPVGAIAHGRRLLEQGADIIDVGGASTRPGAAVVPVDEEIRRVVPVIEALSRAGAIVSIDTYRSEVAQAAIGAGAHVINDISAGRLDPAILGIAARHGVALVLSHMQGTPSTMQQAPRYGDVVAEVRAALLESAEAAQRKGVAREQIVLDPGIGFGKTVEHNLRLLASLRKLCDTGFAVLVGTSRKSFIGHILGGAPPQERLEGTAASVAFAIARGANMVRVHDVKEMVRVARVADAIARAGTSGGDEAESFVS